MNWVDFFCGREWVMRVEKMIRATRTETKVTRGYAQYGDASGSLTAHNALSRVNFCTWCLHTLFPLHLSMTFHRSHHPPPLHQTPYLSFQLYDFTASFTGAAWAFIFVALLQALGDIKKKRRRRKKELKRLFEAHVERWRKTIFLEHWKGK